MRASVHWLDAALCLVHPRRCPVCDTPLGTLEACPDCAPLLKSVRHEPPRLPAGEHVLSGVCEAGCAYYYEGAARDAVLALKFSGKPWHAREMGDDMARILFGCTAQRRLGVPRYSGEMPFAPFDCIVPVPHSPDSRSYAVPLLLARRLSAAMGIPVESRALRKVRKTARQEEMPNRQSRLHNLRNAFAVAPGGTISGKRVLLVDDVITTGATMFHCVMALHKGGAVETFCAGYAAAEERTPAAKPKQAPETTEQR